MSRVADFSNLITGFIGTMFIAAAFFISGSDVTAGERIVYFLIGAALILLCVYVLQIDAIANPEGWQTGLRVLSIILGVVFAVCLVLLTWFVIQLLKAATEAVAGVMGGK